MDNAKPVDCDELQHKAEFDRSWIYGSDYEQPDSIKHFPAYQQPLSGIVIDNPEDIMSEEDVINDVLSSVGIPNLFKH